MNLNQDEFDDFKNQILKRFKRIGRSQHNILIKINRLKSSQKLIWNDLNKVMSNNKELNNKTKSLEIDQKSILLRINKVVAEEIKIALANEGFKLFLVKTTKNFIKSNLQNIIEQIILETINKLNKNIKGELQITKSLCYSIDSEIKTILKANDFSYELDRKIECAIHEAANKFIVQNIKQSSYITKLQLEDKQNVEEKKEEGNKLQSNDE